MSPLAHPNKATVHQSLTSPSEFWLAAARDIDWIHPPSIAYGSAQSHVRLPQSPDVWFPDGVLNTCYNALDRHCIPTPTDPYPGKRAAIHWVSPLPTSPLMSNNPSSTSGKQAKVTRSKDLVKGTYGHTISYEQALEEVKALAGVLKHMLGVKKGDRVVIYMPMIPAALYAMLACARLGAVHSVVFGGFGGRELAKRIDDAKPKCVLAASAGLEPGRIIDYGALLDSALSHASYKPSSVLFLSRSAIPSHHPPPHYEPSLGSNGASHPQYPSVSVYSWVHSVTYIHDSSQLVHDCTPVRSDEPLYTLYTSGTTGSPKGVVRASGGHAVALRYSMEHVFGMSKGECMWAASDVGWVVGHSYIVYAPLLLGCATVVYEGKPVTPDAGIFWKVIQDYKVNSLFTAPTALRAIRREDPDASLMRQYNLRTLRALFLAGERSEPGIIKVYTDLLKELAAPGARTNDNYWSTESGSPITAIMLSHSFSHLPSRPGSAGLPAPGMDIRCVDDEGKEVPVGQMGNLVLGKPLAPSALIGLWENEEGFHKSYWARFAGKGDWFDTGDSGMIDQDGYVHVLSRADDIINVAAHRLSTGLLEQVIASHSQVAECCVVGLPDSLKGHVPFAVISLSNSADSSTAPDANSILRSLNAQIRTDVGAIAALGGLVISPGKLPKTRSGKTLRRTVRGLVENAVVGQWDKDVPVPPTVEDMGAVADTRKAINEYFKKRPVKAKL